MSAGGTSTRRPVGSVGLAGTAAVIGRLWVTLVDRRRRIVGRHRFVIGRRLVGDTCRHRLVGGVIEFARVRVRHVALLRNLLGTDRTSGTGIQAPPNARSALYRAVGAIEPWYDWGTIHIERMEGTDPATMNPGGEGPVRFVQLQWFGLHLGFQVGRTPQKWSH